ncbi:unnamed protein product [Gordionus sp. m RMFG-2023]|uniref:polypeptide N-acetylgalactosaminyltransferase 5-like n=1 Tax=Gordionus sp. m RMFG-2023 TaxID=3053472 RepID=UPI0030DF256C
MSSTIYICPKLLPQKLRLYLHNLAKKHNRRRAGSSSFYSCRCLLCFAFLWIIALWIFLSFNEDTSAKNVTSFPNRNSQDLIKISPLQPFDIHRIGQKIVNLPKKFYQNFAEVVDNWAGHPDEAGVGVLPPPDQDETMDPKGYGDNGEAVVFKKLNPEQQKEMDEGWQNNAFNQYVSDRISLHRKLPEVRDKECLAIKYDYNLPTTSIVMCFHNEAFSVLLRGVHSIIDRTPSHLLKEIILVDDFSDMDHVKGKLDKYIAKLGKVRVVRTKRREGLIRARLIGAANATGDVITFLDSHIECANGWAEPLLQRIKEDESRVVCPVIDVIDDSTFKFHYSGAIGTNLGGFDWNLQFNWHAIPEREKKRRKSAVDPLFSPTMAGGLFSIHRGYFEKIGTYDAAMDIWGGENLELSFRVWMCGGTLEIIPCSHIGHIFRKRSPYKWKAGENVLKKNSVRLAMVWLDEYADYYFQRINHDYGNYGDISSRIALRERLKCHNFSWYIHNVYPELFVPGDAYSTGEIRNMGNNSFYCLDSAANKQSINKPVNMYPCHRQGGNQYWMLSKDGEIRRDDMCIDYAGSAPVVFPCHSQKGNQYWVYNPIKKSIEHFYSKLCLEMNIDGQTLVMKECNKLSHQQWDLEKYKYGVKISNEV